jgi:acyl-CoA thioester hydrolase
VPVWQGDVDPFGELHSTTLLRFLQETATRASAEAGFDGAYYERIGRMWLVRRSTVTWRAPIRYGDEITGRTWIADVRRVRSQREYEVRVSDAVVVRAHTDWVLVDVEHGRPRRVPPEIERTLLPDGGTAPERPPFPDDPPPSHAERRARRVETHELDGLNHVNNANYVRYVEESVLDMLTGRGWPLARQRAAGGRLRRIGHDLEYLVAAVYGDRLQTVVWPDEIGDTTVGFRTWIVRAADQRPLLRARSHYAWIDDGTGVTTTCPPMLRTSLRETPALSATDPASIAGVQPIR